MEAYLIIGGLIFIAVLGLQAWFFYQLLQETRQESGLYRGAIERQLQLAALPHIHCDIQPISDSQGTRLGIYNIGSTPAYDLHLDLIAAYTVEALDLASFMRTFVQPRFRKYPLQADKVGYYGIRNSHRQPFLAYQKRLEVPLQLPANPVDIYVLLQYREISGNNYHQVYCFSEVNDRGGYRANLVEPLRADLIERLHFYDTDDAKTSPQDKTLPFPLKAFIDLWNHSISAKYTVLEADGFPTPLVIQNL